LPSSITVNWPGKRSGVLITERLEVEVDMLQATEANISARRPDLVIKIADVACCWDTLMQTWELSLESPD